MNMYEGTMKGIEKAEAEGKSARSIFYTKTGWLTDYALSCGYCETWENGDFDRLRLGKEHGVYFVKGFLNREHIVESFDKLTEARKFFNDSRNKQMVKDNV